MLNQIKKRVIIPAPVKMDRIFWVVLRVERDDETDWVVDGVKWWVASVPSKMAVINPPDKSEKGDRLLAFVVLVNSSINPTNTVPIIAMDE
tara:strand:+ start:44 stop:316 length:273 start_codon:yes stop_codon:yes gene_type:complete